MTEMLILLAHALLVTGFTLRILLRDDLSPSSRLAWFMVITIVPVFGCVIYFLFGEDDPGHAARIRHQEIAEAIKSRGASALGNAECVNEIIDAVYRPAFRYAASVNGFNTTGGNHAELMADAATARARLIADIDAATDHVHLLYYIWLDDETGTNTARALIRAVKRGVVCRAMADGLGSRALTKSALWQEMKEAGVHLAVALPVDRPIYTILTSRLDLRNHRKITIIDGRVTYCGSQNCADPEYRVKAKYAPWVDIMLRIEGPVVAQNQLLFASDWLFAGGGGLENLPLITDTVAKGFPAQVVGDGPTERPGATPQLFATLIGTAIETLTISTPYFVPDATVLDAICAAAHRGVRVLLVVPKNNDSWVVAAASHSYYRTLLEAGVQIHEFVGGLLHAKTLTIDGRITLLGSTNIDLRSFDLNYENDILLQDEATTRAVSARQADYLTQSQQVIPDEVRRWPLYRRVWNNVISTIGPVL